MLSAFRSFQSEMDGRKGTELKEITDTYWWTKMAEKSSFLLKFYNIYIEKVQIN